MFPRVFQTITFLLISASLVLSSPSPAPIPDSNIAHVIAVNKNMGCSGPQGCVASQPNGTQNVAAIFAKSGALSSTPSGATSALAAAVAVAGGLSVAALL